MISILRRLGKDLLTLFWGADPAAPLPPLRRRWLRPLLVLAAAGLLALAAKYLQDTRHMSAPVAMALGAVTVLPLLVLWAKPLWAWRIAYVGLLVGSLGQTSGEAWPWNPVQVLVTIAVMVMVALREPPGVIFCSGVSVVLLVSFRVEPGNVAGVTVLIAVLLVLGEHIGRRRFQRAEVTPSERGEKMTWAPAWRARLAKLASVLRRLGWDLLTVLWGADPAQPLPPIKRWWIRLPLVLAGVGLYLEAAPELSNPVSMVLAFVTVLSLVVLWRKPLWAWRLAFAGLLIGGFGQTQEQAWPWNPVQTLAAIVILFVVALREPPGIIFWIGVSAALTVWIRSDNAAAATVLIAVLLVLGEQIGRRRRLQRALVVQSERGEIAEAREAILVERTRIARELHDVVAHSMSLVAVRAETAPYRLPGLPDPARDEFLALAATARDSLTELRRLLGVLRTEQTEPELTPQPDLSDLDDLVASARQAGMQVATAISGPSPSAATGLTTYRIVQEALSNAARHASGAPVEVTVTTTKRQTRVEVRNGPGAPAPSPQGTGHGLVGMRERVELLGGTLRTGPTDDGGFAVVATIPGGPR
ncbi:sensor histidine kinase [Rhizocola hellebori]|nr:sensor histidine kinase [Rhizocola hellebori]